MLVDVFFSFLFFFPAGIIKVLLIPDRSTCVTDRMVCANNPHVLLYCV